MHMCTLSANNRSRKEAGLMGLVCAAIMECHEVDVYFSNGN